jgi:high affinity Mn2+ porin
VTAQKRLPRAHVQLAKAFALRFDFPQSDRDLGRSKIGDRNGTENGLSGDHAATLVSAGAGLQSKPPTPIGALAAAALAGALVVTAPPAWAADDTGAALPPDQTWAVHGQATVAEVAHLAFSAPYSGANSLSSDAEGRETVDVTLMAGFRPWDGAEVWLNPEIDQGFGLNDTLGIAGFPSAEAYKVGEATPYFRLPRAFLRQTLDLGGEAKAVDPDLNQLGGHQTDNRLVLWLGKFSVPDVFDTNDYAHDPRHDFMNWGVIEASTFDYAADAWGYTYGAAAEWYQGPWTLRTGLFDLSTVPNGTKLDTSFGQFQMIGEVERRWSLGSRPGALKITGFLSRGRMARFADAIALGDDTGAAPDVSRVRQYRGRGGVSLDAQQQFNDVLGGFLRGGLADGDVEPYEFTDVDRTISGGVSARGKAWGRPGDSAGLALEVNGLSKVHQQYLADGGLGVLVGDGRLPHPGEEEILETYYDVPVGRWIHLAADYQFVENPGYNRDRGPVSIFAARVHAQF